MNNKTLKRIIITDLFFLLFLVSLFVPMTYSQTWTIDTESIFEKDDFDNYQIASGCFDIFRKKNNALEGPMDSAWPMYMHDVKHTGRSPYSTTNNEGLIKWTFWTDFGIDSSPAIDGDGIIYVSSHDQYLHALYPNGTEKWRAYCGHWLESSPAISEDGTIYVGSLDDNFYAINPNGTIKWKFYVDDIHGSPVIDENGIIYFGVLGPGSDIGRIYALYPNGTEKWHYDTDFLIFTSPSIGEDGTIYVTSRDNNMYALYPDNGTCKWSYGFGGWPGSPSIADDGTIYIGSYDGNLYALYPNGTLKWKHGIDWGTCHTPAIDDDGTIYIGQKYLYAINPDGTRKWTYEPGDENEFEVTTSCAISADGTIYFGVTKGTYQGDIIAVDYDGTEIWRKRIANDWVYSSPVIGSDGTVYIGSQSRTSGNAYGLLYAFGELDPNAPVAPIITGETQGHIGEVYEYTFMSTDPENKDVSYYIDWGDGAFEDWFGPYDSGEEVVVSHTWSEQDTYTIRARARDTDNLWGPWGELEVTMPVNQEVDIHPFLQRILERFPNAFPILRLLLGL